MFAGAVLLLVTGCVFLLSRCALSVLAWAYAQYRERYLVRSLHDLSEMFLFVGARQLLVLNLASMCLLGLLGALLSSALLAVALTLLGFFLPALLVRHYRARRVRRFNVQLVEALQSMASALRAGLTLPQALEQVARDAPAPLSQELGLCVREARLGVSLEGALENMGRRVGSDDLELVVVATTIARGLGGNLAEVFDTLSGVVRERFRLEGKIDALTSQGRLQGWIVSAMPLALGGVLDLMRPDLVEPMMEHAFGYVLVTVVVLMELVGILLIRRIVRIDI